MFDKKVQIPDCVPRCEVAADAEFWRQALAGYRPADVTVIARTFLVALIGDVWSLIGGTVGGGSRYCP